ncbi:aminotransferase class V-fold PLP-dependent enzyme [Bacillus sp. sid0103]|uniref:aminotransferase class V-fold PLP-dependent enzyme n=1 Tax=Bacillus sp. sid0103 TaxID=2856337 RepID=UPI001C444DAB|nr:aminotransferase class V-fold PLP-dependent enzyme [Bacillus sp. sid0103]MBV7509459.1 aminotransferase class V-fold PLP-dependent enzyme [Bacillus sp. sid0103]
MTMNSNWDMVCPLPSLTLEEAKSFQFRLIDEMTKIFPGGDLLTRGDLGVVPGHGKPTTTKKVEEVIANFFDAEAALLVRGAGTMAIRLALHSGLKPCSKLLIHEAPVYPTTKTSIEMMGLETISANFNHIDELKSIIAEHPDLAGALVQVTRQTPYDSYDLEEVIGAIREVRPELFIVTDDNYAVMKMAKIGCQVQADLACFSLFKLLGPEGIGCIVGNKEYIDRLKEHQYSGGSQVQGYEALDALRGLVYAPVMLAIQAEVNEQLVTELRSGAVEGVKDAFLANAQSKVLIVELEKPIAKEVLKEAEKLGAAPYPVGAESKYEMVPMFYRVSGTFLIADPTFADRMIRINPLRSGSETVKRILSKAIAVVSQGE